MAARHCRPAPFFATMMTRGRQAGFKIDVIRRAKARAGVTSVREDSGPAPDSTGRRSGHASPSRPIPSCYAHRMIFGADCLAEYRQYGTSTTHQAANDASENVTNEPKMLLLQIAVSPFSIKTFIETR